jgi:hypothetical protein
MKKRTPRSELIRQPCVCVEPTDENRVNNTNHRAYVYFCNEMRRYGIKYPIR